MIYTPMTKKAMKLCYEAHKEQSDKSGLPYVFHPFHLAEQMKTEQTVTVALLHDVVEDSDYTLEDLIQMGFPATVTDAVDLLTHRDGEDYLEYVRKIRNNPIAREVKIADLMHNSDLTRLDEITDRARERREKYQKALSVLQEA